MSFFGDPPPPQLIPRPMPRMGGGVCWSELVVAAIVKDYGPITPHPDPEKARLLKEGKP